MPTVVCGHCGHSSLNRENASVPVAVSSLNPIMSMLLAAHGKNGTGITKGLSSTPSIDTAFTMVQPHEDLDVTM